MFASYNRLAWDSAIATPYTMLEATLKPVFSAPFLWIAVRTIVGVQ
jgi:hypothetical protein